MASVYQFYEEAEHTESILYSSFKIQNDIQIKVNWAATKIQSFFRGLMVRCKMEQDKKAAITIQRYVRGWLLRYHLPDKLQEYYDQVCFNFYNKAAAKIQATWKGYVFRKFTFSIKDVLDERNRIAKGNEEIYQLFTRPFVEFNKNEYEISDHYIHEIYKVLFDRHHLLRTKHIKGVLSKAGTEELSILEKLIKVMPWKDFMDGIHKLFYKFSDQYELADQINLRDQFIKTLLNKLYDLPMPSAFQKKFDFNLSPKIEREPVNPILSRGKFVPPIRTNIRVSDSSKQVGCFKFNNVPPHSNRLKMGKTKPGYRIDFWYEECSCGHRDSR